MLLPLNIHLPCRFLGRVWLLNSRWFFVYIFYSHLYSSKLWCRSLCPNCSHKGHFSLNWTWNHYIYAAAFSCTTSKYLNAFLSVLYCGTAWLLFPDILANSISAAYILAFQYVSVCFPAGCLVLCIAILWIPSKRGILMNSRLEWSISYASVPMYSAEEATSVGSRKYLNHHLTGPEMLSNAILAAYHVMQ